MTAAVFGHLSPREPQNGYIDSAPAGDRARHPVLPRNLPGDRWTAVRRRPRSLLLPPLWQADVAAWSRPDHCAVVAVPAPRRAMARYAGPLGADRRCRRPHRQRAAWNRLW